MRRFESVEAFAQFRPEDWPTIAAHACRLAIVASDIDDLAALDALQVVEQHRRDHDIARLMRSLADRLDEDAWDTQKSGDDERYDLLFRRSRAVSALAFALSGEPDEAIYEAAHAVGSAENLVRRLRS